MIIEYFRQIIDISNLMIWKYSILGILLAWISFELILLFIVRALVKNNKFTNQSLLVFLLRSFSKGIGFFCIAFILFILQRSIETDELTVFFSRLIIYGFLNIGIAIILFSFTGKIYKAETEKEKIKDSIKKIVKLSHKGINRSILAGIFLIYTRMLWKFIPTDFKAEYWLIALVVVNALILSLILFLAFQKILPLLVEYLEKMNQPLKILLIIIKSLIGPLKILTLALFILMIKDFIQFNDQFYSFIILVLKLCFSMAVLSFLYKMVDSILYSLSKYSESEDNSLDKTLFEMFRMINGILFLGILAIIVIKIITGKELTTLFAGLGIGGLAVALAAQDTLKNFFGSIMIMTDKPFKIGERIVAEGYDGVIESIGFRSTRIRTLAGHQVIIPNDKVAQIPVENIGKRPYIRRLTDITITYDTPIEKIEKALAIIREILKDHEGMLEDMPPRVNFNEFNSESLNILMLYWYSPPNYWDFLAFNEKVNIAIMKGFAKEGIEFAFPTNTTYLEQSDGKSIKLSIDDMQKNKKG